MFQLFYFLFTIIPDNYDYFKIRAVNNHKMMYLVTWYWNIVKVSYYSKMDIQHLQDKSGSKQRDYNLLNRNKSVYESCSEPS